MGTHEPGDITRILARLGGGLASLRPVGKTEQSEGLVEAVGVVPSRAREPHRGAALGRGAEAPRAGELTSSQSFLTPVRSDYSPCSRAVFRNPGPPVASSWKLRRPSGIHILRHTFCSHLAMHGAPARTIQELAGHQDSGHDAAIHAPEPGGTRRGDSVVGDGHRHRPMTD